MIATVCHGAVQRVGTTRKQLESRKRPCLKTSADRVALAIKPATWCTDPLFTASPFIFTAEVASGKSAKNCTRPLNLYVACGGLRERAPLPRAYTTSESRSSQLPRVFRCTTTTIATEFALTLQYLAFAFAGR